MSFGIGLMLYTAIMFVVFALDEIRDELRKMRADMKEREKNG